MPINYQSFLFLNVLIRIRLIYTLHLTINRHILFQLVIVPKEVSKWLCSISAIFVALFLLMNHSTRNFLN